jgi:hypothetical protein
VLVSELQKDLDYLVLHAIGYISSDGESSKEIGSTLKELILCHIDGRVFLKSENLEMESSNEATAIKSICSSLYKALTTAEQPTESVLGVISVLFLKLGISYNYRTMHSSMICQFSLHMFDWAHNLSQMLL